MPTIETAVDARKTVQGARQHNQAVRSMGSAARDAQGRFLATEKRLGGLSDAARNAGKMLAGMFAIGGLAAGIRQTMQTITDFEETMTTVRGVSGATAEEFERLTAKARELGATTRFSATEAGEGLLFLARAGFDTTEALDAVESTLNLAAAGGIALGEAADYASNIVQQFGLAASETERVVDALVVTANNANTDVRQLAEAMKFAGPIAGSLGISLEETAAAMGALGDSGIQAGMAGTGLRMVMLRLVGPTGEARAAIESLGLSMSDVDPTANSLVDVFGRLDEAGLTAAQAQKIFGTETAAVALTLSEATEKMEELGGAMDDGEGTAQDFASMMNDTLSGSMKALGSAISELQLQAGQQGLLGVMRGIIDTATNTALALGGMSHEIDGNRRLYEGLAHAVTFATTAITTFAAVRVLGFLGSLASGLRASTLATHGLTAAMKANPIGLLATGLSIAAGAFMTFRSATAESTDELNAHTDAIERLLEAQERLSRGMDSDDPARALRGVAEITRQIEEAMVEVGRIQSEGIAVRATADMSALSSLVESGTIEMPGGLPEFLSADVKATQEVLDLLEKQLEKHEGMADELRDEVTASSDLTASREEALGVEQAITEERERQLERLGRQERALTDFGEAYANIFAERELIGLDDAERAVREDLREFEEMLRVSSLPREQADALLAQVERELRKNQELLAEQDQQPEDPAVRDLESEQRADRERRAMDVFLREDTRARGIELGPLFSGIGDAFAASRGAEHGPADPQEKLVNQGDQQIIRMDRMVDALEKMARRKLVPTVSLGG